LDPIHQVEAERVSAEQDSVERARLAEQRRIEVAALGQKQAEEQAKRHEMEGIQRAQEEAQRAKVEAAKKVRGW
jgi:hypothetical protein